MKAKQMPLKNDIQAAFHGIFETLRKFNLFYRLLQIKSIATFKK